MKKLLYLIVFVSLFAFPFNLSAANFKIGIVDMQQIIQTSKVGQQILAKLKKQAATKKATLEKKGSNLQKKQQELQNSVVLSPQARKKKQTEIMEMQQSLQMEFANAQREFQTKEMEETKIIIGQVQKIIAVYAKQKAYDLIVEKTLYTAILYSKNKPTNITKIILKQYNAAH